MLVVAQSFADWDCSLVSEIVVVQTELHHCSAVLKHVPKLLSSDISNEVLAKVELFQLLDLTESYCNSDHWIVFKFITVEIEAEQRFVVPQPFTKLEAEVVIEMAVLQW